MNEDARIAALQRSETPHPDEIQHKKFRRVPRNDCRIISSSDPDPKPKPLIKKEELPENKEIKKEPPSEFPAATNIHPHQHLIHQAVTNGQINGRDVEHVRNRYAQMRIKEPISPPTPLIPKPRNGSVGAALAATLWRPGIPSNGEEPPINPQQSPTERRSAFTRHGSSPASENGRPAPPPTGFHHLSLRPDLEVTRISAADPHPHPPPHLAGALLHPQVPQTHIPPTHPLAALHIQHRLQQPAFPNLAHPPTLPQFYLQQHAALQHLQLQHGRPHHLISSWSNQQVGGHTTLEREVSPPPREANSASQSHSPTLSSSPASTEGHRENGVSRKRKSEVVPEWVKTENIEDFKRSAEYHCRNDQEIKDFIELRRKIKNRDAAQRSRQKRIEGTNLLKQKNIELRKEYAEENAFYGNLQEKVKNKERQYEELLRRKDKIHRWIERKRHQQKATVVQRNHS